MSVHVWKLHAGRPIDVCDACRRGVPSSANGRTWVAMTNTTVSRPAIANRAARTYHAERGRTRSPGSVVCSVGGTM